ncbi:ATP-binding cassette domain-containing protein, partial [Acidobacteriota bacterium]
EVEIFGLDHSKNQKEIKNRIAYVGEEHNFYGNKTVAWTGKFISSFFQNWDINTFQKYLTDFSISRSKKVKDLSKGQRAKFSLALALSHNPELAILDEPTAGLDPIIRRTVLDILAKFTEDGERSVIISSHLTDDLARIADLIAFIVDGQIILTAAKDDLLSNWKRIHYRNGSLNTKISEALTCRREQAFGSSGLTRQFPVLRKDLEEGIEKGDIKIENANLDDILISLVKGD